MKETTLLDYCEEEARTKITCGSCLKENVQDSEALVAIDEFYQDGWRVRKGMCYCPSCSKDLGIK